MATFDTHDSNGEPVLFTSQQLERLREIAEERDTERARTSKFSHGEQEELDETADALRTEHIDTAEALRSFRL